MYRPAIISVPQKQTTLPSRIIGRRDPPMRWQNHDLGAGPLGFRAHAGPIPEALLRELIPDSPFHDLKASRTALSSASRQPQETLAWIGTNPKPAR